MKLSKKFIMHNSGEESLLVPTGEAEFSGVVKGNKILGQILSLLTEDTDEDSIIEKMEAIFDADRDIISKDVKKALAELRKVGALDA